MMNEIRMYSLAKSLPDLTLKSAPLSIEYSEAVPGTIILFSRTDENCISYSPLFRSLAHSVIDTWTV